MDKLYPEDFFLLNRQITLRKIDEYLSKLQIAMYPHLEKEEDRDELTKDLINQRRFMRGEEKIDEKLDRASLEKFRHELKENSRLIKVSDNINKDSQEK